MFEEVGLQNSFGMYACCKKNRRIHLAYMHEMCKKIRRILYKIRRQQYQNSEIGNIDRGKECVSMWVCVLMVRNSII